MQLAVAVTGPTGTVNLPAEYVVDHLELGYAQTSQASQGRTVDTALILIDTTTDKFLPDTPIRVRIDDESANLQAARAQAREQGGKIVADDVLAENRGFLAGFNAITEISADPYRMTVNPRPVFPHIDAQLEFKLEEISLGEVEAQLTTEAKEGEPLVKQDLLAMPLREAREHFERAYLQQQLLLCGGKVGQLAKRVGMERTHLYRKLRSLGVDFRQSLTDD